MSNERLAQRQATKNLDRDAAQRKKDTEDRCAVIWSVATRPPEALQASRDATAEAGPSLVHKHEQLTQRARQGSTSSSAA